MKSVFLLPVLAQSVTPITPLADFPGDWTTITSNVDGQGKLDLKYRTVQENFDGYSLWAPYLEAEVSFEYLKTGSSSSLPWYTGSSSTTKKKQKFRVCFEFGDETNY